MYSKWLKRLRTLRNRRVTEPFSVDNPEPFDPAPVAVKPAKATLTSLRRGMSGRFHINVDGGRCEGFLRPSPVKRLFVFLSAAGRTTRDTRFDRISWHPVMNGACLYIDDPMYKRFRRLAGGWYYGDGEKTYLHAVAKIVRAVAAGNYIHPRNIIFVGSSASGYAALYVADLIHGSVALAYNPQIRLRDWIYADAFSKITGVDLSSDDSLGRNCLRRITDNKSSRFFIACNTASGDDYDAQIKPWLDEIGVKSRSGLIREGNVHFLLHHTPAAQPHYAFPGNDQTCLLLKLLLDETGPDGAAVSAFYRTVTETVLGADREHYLRTWSDLISQPLPEMLVRPPSIDSPRCVFCVRGLPAMRYELAIGPKKTVSVAFIADGAVSIVRLRRAAGKGFTARPNEIRAERVPIAEMRDVLSDLAARTESILTVAFSMMQTAAE